MSCYKIEYNQTGAKILTPVSTREEYIALRGQAIQKSCVSKVRNGNVTAKRRLLQFNYSCIPDASGLLKGNKIPSTTFGMDIDRPKGSVAPLPNPLPVIGEGVDTPEKEDTWLQEQIEKVLAKKAEVGLLMLEKSVRNGLHLVMKRDCSLSQEENLKKTAEILEVEFDAGAKDITRVFYATTDSPDDLLYLDDALFIQEASEVNSEQLKVNSPSDEQSNQSTSPSGAFDKGQNATGGASEEASLTPYAIKAFDLCRVEAGLAETDLDKEGSRHNNLKAILSVGLCQLMSQNELLAVVKAKMPNYWNDGNDAQTLVKNFYENYCDPNGRMTLTLRKIYAKAQASPQPSPEGEGAMGAGGLDSPLLVGEGQGVRLPPLPRLLQLLVKAYPEEYRPAVVMSSLVFLGALLSRLRAFYLDNSPHSPSFICCVTAPQASGKSFTRRLYDLLTEPIKLNDKIGRKLEREYLDKKKSAKNSRQQPEDPKALIRLIPATASNAMILKRADYANGLHLCTYAEEIDTLVKGQKAGAWSEKSDLYRMAFDNAEWGQDYMSDNSYSGQVKLFYNLLVCGTPNAMNRFFKDVEDGLVSRVMFVQLPDMLGSKMPKFGNYSHQELHEIKETVKQLWEMGSTFNTENPDDTAEVWLNSPELIGVLGNWLEDKRQVYLQNQDNPALEVFRRRAGVCGFRAGMIAYAMNGMKWSKDCEEFALWVAEFTLQNQLALFGEKMNRVMAEQEEGNSHMQSMKSSNGRNFKLLDELPEKFTMQDVINIRLSYGFTGVPYYICSRWEKNGLVEKVDKTHWCKTI